MAQPSFTQVTFRIRDDDGDETGATWLELQGDDHTHEVDDKFRVRFLCDEANSKAWTSQDFNLYYNHNGGGYLVVTNTTPIQWTTSIEYSDGDDTTSQLTGGTGTHLTDNNGMCSGDASATNTGVINQYFEVEYVLTIDSAQVDNNDTILLRVYRGTAAFTGGYTDTPTITVSETIVTGAELDGVGNITASAELAKKSGASLDGVGNITAKPLEAVGAFGQPHFRFRTGDTEALNDNSGWEDAIDTDVTLPVGNQTDDKFRLRLEVEEENSISKSATFKLQTRKDGGSWVDLVLYPDDPSTATSIDGCLITPSAQYNDADVTTNILSGSSKVFVAGSGEENNLTGSITLDNEHTELEWTLLMHHLYDARGYSPAGTTWEFRIVESDGTPFSGSYVYPKVTVSVPVGHIGGTYSEGPMKVGPYKDSNGNLYCIVECSEDATAGALPMMMKSTDGGDTWVPQDASSGPTEKDMEAADVIFANDRLYIAQHRGSNVLHHVFRVSTEGSNPDTWQTIDDEIVSGMTYVEQFCSMTRRSDGDLIIFYTRTDTDERIKYKINDGSWGAEQSLDSESGVDFYGVGAVLGESDKTHIFYVDWTNGILYHNSLTSGDSLTGRESVSTNLETVSTAARGAITPPVYYDSGGVEKVMIAFSESDIKIYSSIVSDDGSPSSPVVISTNTVARNGGSSKLPQADISVDGTVVNTFFVEATSQDIYKDRNDDGGGWGTVTLEISHDNIDYFRAQTFTHSSGNGGETVVGYIWDEGSDGYTGYVRYDEYVIPRSGAELDGVGDITATCTVVSGGAVNSGAELDGVGNITASAGLAVTSTTQLDGVGTLTAIAGVSKTSRTQLDGIGSITADAGVAKTSKTQFDGVGSLTTIASASLNAQTQLDGVGSITVSVEVASKAQTSLDGVGSVTVAPSLIVHKTELSVMATPGKPHSFQAKAAPGVVEGKTALAGVGTVTISAEMAIKSTTALDGAGTLIVIAETVQEAQTQLDGVGSLTTIAKTTLGAQAALSGTGSLTATAQIVQEAQTQLDGVGTLTAIASLEGQLYSGAELDGVGSITTDAKLDAEANAALAGGGTLIAIASVGKTSGAELDGVGDITVTAQTAQSAQTQLDGISSITVIAQTVQNAQIQLDGVGNIVAVGTLEGEIRSGAELDGVGSITISAQVAQKAQVQLDGIGSITASAGVAKTSKAELDGVGSLTVIAQVTHNAQTQLDGVGTLTAAGTLEGQVRSGAELDGVGQITASAELAQETQTQLDAVGTITATASIQHGAQTQLDGVGTLAATGASGAAVQSGAQLDGVGSVTTTAQLVFNANTSLDGVGNITADAVMSYAGIVSLDGAGAILAAGSAFYLTGAILDGVGSIVAGSTIALAYEGLIPVTSVIRDFSTTVEDRELVLDVTARDADLDVESR